MAGGFRNIGMPGYIAGGTIAPKVFVKHDTNAYKVVTAGAGDPILGVSQQGQKVAPGTPGADSTVAASSGDQIDIYAPGDYVVVTVGSGGLTAGQWIKSDGSGGAVAHTTGAAMVAGRAEHAAAAGELVHLFLYPQYISI